jgi:hypothetical protein
MWTRQDSNDSEEEEDGIFAKISVLFFEVSRLKFTFSQIYFYRTILYLNKMDKIKSDKSKLPQKYLWVDIQRNR